MGTILLVEDDPDIAELVAVVLCEAGHDVRLIPSRDAVDYAMEHRPGLILLDLMMPPPDGWDVGRRMSAYPATADIPLVVMSASTTTQTESGWSFPCPEGRRPAIITPHYLRKPFDLHTLITTVNRLLQASIPA